MNDANRRDEGRDLGITHYQARITIEGHYSPERGELTDGSALQLANNGSTPREDSTELTARAERLKQALLSGRVVRTGTAEIWPLTTEDFKAGRLGSITGYEEIKRDAPR